ncbi:MAG: hypothetical protein ACAH59_04000 [Pseudobdellovibrionaceae bacterium]
MKSRIFTPILMVLVASGSLTAFAQSADFRLAPTMLDSQGRDSAVPHLTFLCASNANQLFDSELAEKKILKENQLMKSQLLRKEFDSLYTKIDRAETENVKLHAGPLAIPYHALKSMGDKDREKTSDLLLKIQERIHPSHKHLIRNDLNGILMDCFESEAVWTALEQERQLILEKKLAPRLRNQADSLNTWSSREMARELFAISTWQQDVRELQVQELRMEVIRRSNATSSSTSQQTKVQAAQ